MTWVRKDDQMPINRKVAPLSDAAYRLDDEAICWASRNGTNGRIAADELESISSKRGTLKNVDELVRRGRWHRAEDPPCTSETCAEPGPDGWVIHDYLDYNPSAQQVKDEKRAKADRQKRWRDARRGRSTSRDASGDALHDASRDAGVDASRNAPGDAAPRARVSRPAPSRPEGSGTGRPEREAPTARRTAADRAGDGREDQPPPPPPTNGQATREAQAAIRATLANRHRPGPNTRDALDALRAATPDIPPLLEPTQEEPWATPSPETAAPTAPNPGDPSTATPPPTPAPTRTADPTTDAPTPPHPPEDTSPAPATTDAPTASPPPDTSAVNEPAPGTPIAPSATTRTANSPL